MKYYKIEMTDNQKVIGHYPQAKYEEGRARMARWIREGALKYLEDVTDGIEAAPEQFIELMRGHNFGKKLIRIRNSE